MKNIEELNNPPIIGMYYLVPCIIYDTISDEGKKHLYVYPIINNLHSDVDSGQEHEHYHLDYRFIEMQGMDDISVKQKHSQHTFAYNSRYDLLYHNPHYKENYKVEYISLMCQRVNNLRITPTELIEIEKLKNKCIYKNKCPHKGMDLSQVIPKDGIIQCPLHGLKFNAITKELIQT